MLEILKVISNPSRLEILRRIKDSNDEAHVTCSCVLEGMDISQSTFSHHVSELVGAGLVRSQNQGRFVLLYLDEDTWTDFQSSLGKTVFGG